MHKEKLLHWTTHWELFW